MDIARLQRFLAERNWWAEHQLRRYARLPFALRSPFVCRGSIQLAVDKEATIVPPTRATQIGIRILATTVRRTTTALTVKSGATLRLDGAVVGRGTQLFCNEGARLSIGKGSYVNDGSMVAASNNVSIGSYCAISWNVTIIDDDVHGFGAPPYFAPITIGDRVWIGCNATILKGVTLGSGSVIAAGSVVTHSFPPESLIGGVPAKLIREGVKWTDAARHHISEADLQG